MSRCHFHREDDECQEDPNIYHYYDDYDENEAFLPNLVKSCSSLVKLSLGHKSLTINPFTDGICKNGATLTSLNLSGCLYISYDAIRMILIACKELIEANFSAIFPLTEASISFLCLHLTPTIRKLSLEEQYVTDHETSFRKTVITVT